MDVPASPVIAPESGISSDADAIIVEKKTAAAVAAVGDVISPSVEATPTSEASAKTVQKETNHQNGTKDKCPEEVPLPPSPTEERDSESTVAAAATTTGDGPGNSDTDVKSVSLNNENDDRVDSIEVVGQGDDATATAAGATSNSPNQVTGNSNSAEVADQPNKDLEQSPMSKANPEAGAPVSVDTASITATANDVESTPSVQEDEEGNGTNGIENGGGEVDKADKNELIVTENGQQDNNSEPSTAAVLIAQEKEQPQPVVNDGEASEVISEDIQSDQKEDKIKDAEEDSLQVQTVEEVPEEDSATLVIGDCRSVVDTEEGDDMDDVKLPSEAIDTAEEEEDDDGDGMQRDQVMDTLLLEDSQESVDDDEEEDLEEIVDDGVGEEENQVKVKLEPSAKLGENENEIETIDIDTDDDEDEGSLVGPPVDDDDDEDNEDEDEDEDDVDEADFDEEEEEVESLEGEEYQEFEVSDEENESQDPDLQMVEGAEGEGEDISEGASDDERFAQMKSSNRGAKRKRPASDANSVAVQQQREGASKERRVSWLDSGNSPRMHVMESVCRDAMLRRSAEKIEEINSQDEEEGAGDAPLKPLLSANVLNRPEEQQQKKPHQTPSEVAAEEKECAKSAVTSVLEPNVVQVAVESVSSKAKVAAIDSESSAKESGAKSVKVQDNESTGDQGEKGALAEEEGTPKTEDPVVKKEIGDSKDCDKPKSSVTGTEEKTEEMRIADDTVMDLDSQDSESMPTVPNELPKESEKEVPVNDDGALDKIGDSSLASKVKSSPVQAPDAPMPENAANPSTTESVSRAVEVEPSKLENILKRKLSTSSTTTEEKQQESFPQMEGEPVKSPTVNAVKPPEAEALVQEKEPPPPEPEPTTKKARLTETASEQLHRELEENFGRHDKLLREYITRSSSESTEGGIGKHVDQLMMEIEALNGMIRTKETEWNNMIHLRKVKEELVLRLTRKKHVQDIETASLERIVTVAQASQTAAAEMSSGSLFGGSGGGANSKAAVQANKLIKNLQLSSTLSGAAATSKTTQSILQNRANMTTEDLEKEKKNTAKLHRHSIQGTSTPPQQASSVGPHHRNSVSPAPNAHSGRVSAPAVGGGGGGSSRSKTPTSTPLHAGSDSDLEQRMAAFQRLAAAHAMQNQEMMFNSTQQQQQQQLLHQQQQQYEAALALQNHNAAAAAAGQMVGRQGAIKDVRSIIEDYRQRHPESVPRRGRRMKTVPTTNASLTSGSSCSSSLLMLAQKNNNNNDKNQDNKKGSCDAVLDMSGFVMGGGDGQGDETGGADTIKGGGGGVKRGGAAGGATGGLTVVSSGGGEKTKTSAFPEKVKRVKDVTVGGGGVVVASSRRGSEWQAMLNSLSESGTTTTSSVASRPSSAESSHSATSASAINSLLTQHGLLPAISITSLASGGGGGNSETGGGRGSVNVQPPNPAAVHHQQQQQSQSSAHHHATAAAAVAAQQQMQQLLQGSGNSLLHGILTKQHNQQNQQQAQSNARAMQQQQQQQSQQQGAVNGGGAGSGFSPTLARLLTAPERISTVQNVANYQQQQGQNPVMNLSKNLKSEITITPVVSQNNSNSSQYNNMMMSMQDDDQDDNSVDRLVIDEGIHNNGGGGGNLLGNNSASHGVVHGQEFHENEVPECQGCKRKEAQFVCAGCGNQWYCSRECQVTAWDEHSETCTG